MNLTKLVFKHEDGKEIIRMFSSYIPQKSDCIKIKNAIGENRRYVVMDVSTNILHTRDGFAIDYVELFLKQEYF